MNISITNERRGSVLFAARAGMASLAIFGGLEKVFNYQGAVGFSTQHLIPFAFYMMPFAIVLELGCAAMLLTPRYCRQGAAVLAVWTFVLGIWFHQFWAAPAAAWQEMIDSFFHHLVMTGGFVYVAIFGAGDGLDSKT